MFDPEGSTPKDGSEGDGNSGGPGEGSKEYTPNSKDLVRQWHDLEGFYREAKAEHERGECPTTVPAGIQKQLMSVQEQVRKSQESEGRLYTKGDIGSTLSRFARTVYAVIRKEVGEDRAAVLAEEIENLIESETNAS